MGETFSSQTKYGSKRDRLLKRPPTMMKGTMHGTVIITASSGVGAAAPSSRPWRPGPAPPRPAPL